jgi:hypothetical protein
MILIKASENVCASWKLIVRIWKDGTEFCDGILICRVSQFSHAEILAAKFSCCDIILD